VESENLSVNSSQEQRRANMPKGFPPAGLGDTGVIMNPVFDDPLDDEQPEPIYEIPAPATSSTKRSAILRFDCGVTAAFVFTVIIAFVIFCLVRFA